MTMWRAWHAGVLLMATLAGCGVQGGAATPSKDEAKTGEDEARVEVRVEPARLGTERATVDGIGRCQALPDHLATLTPAVEGHVHALRAQEGDTVKEGQPIVELDKSVAQADLDEKTAARDGLKASLALLRSVPRSEERRAHELAVEHAKRAVALAQATVTRIQPLRERREVSEQQLHDAQIALEQARIQQQTAEAQLQALLIGPRPEAVAEAEGKIKTADALVALARAHLEFTTIRSPIDGVLDSLTCHPGQTIAVGTAIGEVVDTRQVFAAVWLAPRSAQAVRVGQAAVVSAHTEREEGRAGLTGKVAYVGRVADPQTGNLPIHILVANPEGTLVIGQTIRASIILAEHEGVLQVPAAAILDLGEGPVLNAIRDGRSVVLHPRVGTPSEGWVAVTGTDLKPGEPVVIEGGYNLPDGTPVRVAGETDEADTKPDAAESGRSAGAKKAEAEK